MHWNIPGIGFSICGLDISVLRESRMCIPAQRTDSSTKEYDRAGVALDEQHESLAIAKLLEHSDDPYDLMGSSTINVENQP
ncbi:hypothetical protein LCGC14_1736340 [marine sediment metagenome]|uniref:Uncharacterized protein n=1 Tax=marine sediment metagenome TaxID=412755 RepID=A0A0F9H809_9ZZZZ